MNKPYWTIITLVLILFASCDHSSEGFEDDESLSFIFHRGGGWIGLDEKLEITEHTTEYSIRYHDLQMSAVISQRSTAETSGILWAYLKKTFDWTSFTKIQDGACRACVDGFDETFSVTKKEGTYSIYNGSSDEYYGQMQDFFDVMLAQACISGLSFSPSSGCSSFFVYKTGNTHHDNIGIAVMGNRENLHLSETEQVFDLSKTDQQDLKVEIKKLSSGSSGFYCDCVFEGELLDTWIAQSGTVKIKIVQDYEGDPSAFEKPCTITVIIENVVLQNDKGSPVIINYMEFNDVGVGWLPG